MKFRTKITARLIMVLVVLAMLFSMISVSVFAAPDELEEVIISEAFSDNDTETIMENNEVTDSVEGTVEDDAAPADGTTTDDAAAVGDVTDDVMLAAAAADDMSDDVMLTSTTADATATDDATTTDDVMLTAVATDATTSDAPATDAATDEGSATDDAAVGTTATEDEEVTDMEDPAEPSAEEPAEEVTEEELSEVGSGEEEPGEEEPGTVIITFDYNGGTDRNTGDTAKTVTAGLDEAINFPAEFHIIPPGERYFFSYWSTSPDGTADYYDPAFPLTLSEDTTFYTIYEEGYFVNLIAEDGYFGDPSIQSNTILNSKDKLLHPVVDPVAFDEQKGFLGWYYDEALTSRYNWEPISSDLTLYAKFGGVFTVSLYPGNGTFDPQSDVSENPRLLYYEEGEYFNGARGPVSYDDSLTFESWYYDEALTQPADEDLLNGILMDHDVSLYAGYAHACTVTLIAKDGHFSSMEGDNLGNVITQKCAEGTPLVFYSYPESDDPALTFNGWYYDEAFTERVMMGPDDLVYGDMTIYAKFDRIFIVELHPGYGYFEDGAGTPTIQIPVREGEYFYGGPEPVSDDPNLIFDGWYIDPPCTAKFDLGNGVLIDHNMTLYAGYGPYFTLTIDANGGTFQEDGQSTVTVKSGTDGIAFLPAYSAETDDPHDSPYAYCTTADGSGTVYQFFDSIELTDNSTVLYMIYQYDCIVTLHAGSGHFWWGDSDTTIQKFRRGTFIDSYAMNNTPEIDDESLRFAYWCLNPECTIPAFAEGGTILADTDFDLYARLYHRNILLF